MSRFIAVFMLMFAFAFSASASTFLSQLDDTGSCIVKADDNKKEGDKKEGEEEEEPDCD